MSITYGGSLFSIFFCMAFSMLAITNTDDKEDEDVSYLGKWMMTFISLFLMMIFSFILHAKEFKTLYIEELKMLQHAERGGVVHH